MSSNSREQLADVLRDRHSGGSFSTRRTAPAADLAIEVRGVGPLRLPVPAAQAKELRLVARPAKYGHGEQTILDRRVRDTWEVPRSRVKIDKRRWNRTLRPMLDTIREDLGLPAGASLKAELHSMLVYEPQQFFAAHQDTEKDDRMIGTLVVMLPSNSTGGDLVVEHRGESIRYRGSASSLTFVAFYSDTRHEVLPVERGYRVVLTYNLMLAGGATPANHDAPALVGTVAGLLEDHFTHTPQPRWRDDRQALEPPDRLVFLLDHQYTERGLSWSHLKGDDATRAGVLRRAAHQARCDVALAHAEIQETWEAFEPPRWRGWSNWDDDLDETDQTDLELGELIDSSIVIAPAAGEPVGLYPDVTDAELATATPTDELTPYDSEYTGYMGNWGNTMDRWYRRAAIVIWPQARSFAIRAKGDPHGAVHELLGAAVDDPQARRDQADHVATLLRFWADGVRRGSQQTLLSPTLRLAWELEDAKLATRLLEPFAIEATTPPDSTVLLALAEQHGERWFDQQLTSWMDHRPRFPSDTTPARAEWLESLPELCTGLRDDPHAPKDLGTDVARTLVNRLWNWMETTITLTASIATPSRRETALSDLSGPLLAVLRSTAITDDPRLRETVIDRVCDPSLRLMPLLVGVVEAATSMSPDQHDEIGVTPIARHCAGTLQADLARPDRADDDWSITEFDPSDCCDDCGYLATFLSDSAEQQLTWPLAKLRRKHIHQRIDETELPVTHHTRREGRPHKLILTKTPSLFTRDAERRAATQTMLDSVKNLLNAVE